MGSGASRNHIGREFLAGPKIGEGSFGVIRRARHGPSKTLLALKIVNIENCVTRSGGADVLQSEISSMKRLSHHQFLCNLHCAYYDKTNCVMVLDLLEGGDLRYHMNDNVDFTEYDVAFIGACIASALQYVHSRGVIHRDVRPENIVLDGQGYPRLIDFGMSHCATLSMVCTECSGNKGYIAPEVLTSSHSHSTESDFWSLGVVMYELLFGELPFHNNCPNTFVSFVEEMYKEYWPTVKQWDEEEDLFVTSASIADSFCATDEWSEVSERSGRSVFSVSLPKSMIITVPMISSTAERVSSAFASVIRGLLDVRVPQRLGAGSNFEALRRHPFFRELNWDSLLTKNLTSPLHMDVNITRVCLEQKFAENVPSAIDCSPTILKLPSNVQNIVAQYSYKCSQFETMYKLDKVYTESLWLCTRDSRISRRVF